MHYWFCLLIIIYIIMYLQISILFVYVYTYIVLMQKYSIISYPIAIPLGSFAASAFEKSPLLY